jgi:regulator of RNase E activity RraA
MEETLSSDQLRELSNFDTATICNAIELFDCRPRTKGYMDDRIKAAFVDMEPMVGYATTATFRAASLPVGTDLYKSIPRQVELLLEIPEPRVVVFQDLDDPPVAATFGEIMCSTYQAFGCSGLITSGAGRDLKQLEKLGFPVFTSGSICSHGYCHLVDINIPIRVGGLTVEPGDLLHGDRDGVTNIPHAIAPFVSSAAAQFADIEERLLKRIGKAAGDPEELRAARSEAADRSKDLSMTLQETVRRQETQ